jgi:hypothetical protein
MIGKIVFQVDPEGKFDADTITLSEIAGEIVAK